MHLLIIGARSDAVETLMDRFRNSDDPPRLPPFLKDLLIDVLINPEADVNARYEEALSALPPQAKDFLRRPIWLYTFKKFDQLENLPDLAGEPVWWIGTHEEYIYSPERYRLMAEQGLDKYWRERGFPPQCYSIEALPDGRNFACD